MCAPVVVGMMAVAAVAGSVQARQESKARKAVARQNSQIVRQRQQDAFRRGEFAEHVQRQKTGLLTGRQRSLIGASGAVVGEGTAASILEDTAALGELDALQARNNAAREAWGLEVQAQQFDFAARKERPGAAFTGSLLSGAASIGSSSLIGGS